MDSQEQSSQQSLKRKLPSSIESLITGENDAIMRNRKVKWTKQEEEGLVAGVNRYGVGMWKNILKDADFTQILAHRSNVDLKDKWRNISIRGTPSPVSKEKSITLESCSEAVEEAAANTPSPSLAAESAKEAETVLKKTENTDSVLQLVKEHLKKNPRTEHVLLSILSLLDGSK